MTENDQPENSGASLESQMRAAARSLIEHHAAGAGEMPGEASGRPTAPLRDPAVQDGSGSSGGIRSRSRRGRRLGGIAAATAVAAAIVAIVLVLLNHRDDPMRVTVNPAQQIPRSEPNATLLVTMGSDMGAGQPGGSSAIVFDADNLETLGEVRLPSLFFLGGLGGTTLDQVSLVNGRLAYVYSTSTDMIPLTEYGDVAEPTDMRAALWREDDLTADRLSYFMQLGPDGTLLSAGRGPAVGSTNTRPGGLSGFDTVIEDRWTITTGDAGGTRSFTWDDGPLPLEDTQVFTPDGSAVVDLHPRTEDGAGSILLTTLALAESCPVCSTSGRSFEIRPVQLGFGVLGAGFLDDTTIWFEWADRAPPDDTNPFGIDPYGREHGLGTLDLSSGETAEVTWPDGRDDPASRFRVMSSAGDGTLYLQRTTHPRDDTDVEKLAALWRWDGSEWSIVDLPAAPEGLEYQDVFVLPGVPDSLAGPVSQQGEWCEEDLDGPLPDVAGLGRRVLDVSGSERNVSDIDGMSALVDAMTPEYGGALPQIWLSDCTIAVSLSDYYWDRLLFHFARTGDGRYALTGTDRWNFGPT